MAARRNLPEYPGEWSQAIAECDLARQSIHTANLRKSASKITFAQFLLLCVLWRQPKQEAEHLKRRWIDQGALQAAKEALPKVSGWEPYLKSLNETVDALHEKGWPGLGMFVVARKYQSKTGDLGGGGGRSTTDCLPKFDFTPVAMRTRSRRQMEEAARLPATPKTPTRVLETVVDTDSESGSGEEHSDEEEVLDVDAGEEDDNQGNEHPTVTLAEDLDHLAISESAANTNNLCPFSPYTGDVARDSKTATDEQVVNAALLVLLDCLTECCPGLQTTWSWDRSPFTVKDCEGNKVYQARVDGSLRHRKTDSILAIIEVKPFRRGADRNGIRMQESAQMAAWISQEPPSPEMIKKARSDSDFRFRRLLISQDAQEIFLTFAAFGAAYVDYICDVIVTDPSAAGNAATGIAATGNTTRGNAATGNAAAPNTKDGSFLVMYEYGPFRTYSDNHMKKFGERIWALCHGFTESGGAEGGIGQAKEETLGGDR